jgi:hypothetical protein
MIFLLSEVAVLFNKVKQHNSKVEMGQVQRMAERIVTSAWSEWVSNVRTAASAELTWSSHRIATKYARTAEPRANASKCSSRFPGSERSRETATASEHPSSNVLFILEC